ncbi:MAG: hypothetical protein WAT16_08790 [Saprospiraceae bacterium]|nr:hypothetical protein [Saprospiraceae bacterium]
MKTIILIIFSLNLCIGQNDSANLELLPDKFLDSDTTSMERLHEPDPDPNLKDTVKVIILVSDTSKYIPIELVPIFQSDYTPIYVNTSNWIYGSLIKSEPSYYMVSDNNSVGYKYKPFYNKQELFSLDFKPLNPNLIVWDYKEVK